MNIKLCPIATVLSIVANLTGYQQLNISAGGLKLLAEVEGCRLSSYKCSAGIWTNGIGNTMGVKPDIKINEKQAAAALIKNVKKVEVKIASCLKVMPPKHIYDALVSLAFNAGSRALCRSDMLYLVNNKQWLAACLQIKRWVYVKGKINHGLQNRRKKEMQWCLNDL
jgi:lysozyme